MSSTSLPTNLVTITVDKNADDKHNVAGAGAAFNTVHAAFPAADKVPTPETNCEKCKAPVDFSAAKRSHETIVGCGQCPFLRETIAILCTPCARGLGPSDFHYECAECKRTIKSGAASRVYQSV